MTRSIKTILLAILLASFGVLITPHARAQDDYFRDLESPREIAPVVQLNPQQDEHYNLAVGPLRFNVAAGVGIEFNDNINLSDHDRQSDIIFRPSLNIDTVWQLSDLNTLRFSMGLSYAKYFDHTQYDTRGVLFSPNSELAMTIMVGEVSITVRDRFSYQEDPYAIPTISNEAVFRRYENLAGIQADYDINAFSHITVGYNHYNLWAVEDPAFDETSHSIDTVYVRPSVKIAPTVTLGLDASYSYIQYDQDVFNNGSSVLAGPYIDWAVTDSTRFYVEGGYQDFISDGGGTIGNVSDNNSYYIKTEIDNRLSDYFNQRLSFSKTIEAGYTSQYYELWHLEYAADWKITPDLVLDPVLFYEHYRASGGETDNGDRFGTDLGLRYTLTPSVTLGADYRFVLNNSDIPDSSYYQNLVLLSLFYNF
jgi:hypothetical protein